MTLTFVNIIHVLLAIAMIILILLQRGAGAAAGSGFGAGASGTVFGSTGASNFLSKSTKWLAAAFFALSLGMAVYASRVATRPVADDLGVMGRAAPSALVQPAPAGDVPVAPDATDAASAAPTDASAVPAAPVDEQTDAAAIDKDQEKN